MRLGLLDPLQLRVDSIGKTDLTDALERWRRRRTVGHAGDLMGRAFVEGNLPVATEVAAWVSTELAVPSPLRALAEHVVADREAAEIPRPETLGDEDHKRRIRVLRRRLRRSPREATTWMDLAREYVAIGQHDSAQQPVRTALALAPENRWILRSAVRYHLHLHEPGAARDLLIRSRRVSFDPWLMAAEIAASTLAGYGPRSVKEGRRAIASGNYPARHYSELATVIATLELDAGSYKAARRLFEAALIEPTENAVAQVEWASREDHRIELPSSALTVPRTFEASAWNSIVEEQWPGAIRAAHLWLADEPFSTRAAVFGSWAAVMVGGDYGQALEFALAGLRSAPRQAVLVNNLVVALANLGQMERAQQELARVPDTDSEDRFAIAHMATKGLVAYRLGDAAGGEFFYRRAAELARQAGNTWMEVLAVLHHAREVDSGSALWTQLVADGNELLPRLTSEERRLAQRFAEVSGLLITVS